MDPENYDSESQLFQELSQVLGEAFLDVESESRLDLDYEVAETVRYEQGQVSWRDRARNSDTELEIYLSHPELPRLNGSLTHVSGDFIIVNSKPAQFLINSNSINAIAGLDDLATISTRPDSISWLENVWFHDLCDRIVDASWYLTGGQVVHGQCVRSGFDAIDVVCGGKVLTIPKVAIAAAKIPLNV